MLGKFLDLARKTKDKVAQSRAARSAREAGKRVSEGIGLSAPPAQPESPPEPGRRHVAEKPQHLTRQGWGEVALMVWKEVERDRLMLVAAGVAFYVLLSIFPALTVLVWIFGLFADPVVIGQMLQDIAFVLPGEALALLKSQLDAITSTRAGFSWVVVATVLIAIWSANAGMKSMIDAMNLIYKEDERRSFLVLNLHSMLFTLAGLTIFLATMGMLIVLPLAFTMLNLGTYFKTLFYYLRWPSLLLITIAYLTFLNRYGPSRHSSRARWAIWGSALGAIMWLVVSLAFSFYVTRLGNLAATYGSLAAIIGLMLWLWLSALVILVGIELNAELERRTDRWEAALRAKGIKKKARGLAGLLERIGLRRSA